MQFVRDVNINEAFAVKFFFRRAAFDAEMSLYEDSDLRSMMPATRALVDNTKQDVRTASGYVLPPAIVIERGESLQEWAAREEHDFVTTLQVCLPQCRFTDW